MINSENSRRNALAMSIGWWYLRRLIRKRGTAAVAGYVAGEGLSFARRPRKRHPIRWLIVILLAGAGGLFWWRRQQGGGDDWGDWEPVAPVAPVAPMPADPEPVEPAPAADPVPAATPSSEADPADLVST
jgi:hypothetical protein